MMRNLLFLLLFSSLNAVAQNHDVWTSVWNKDSTLVGFKDKTGKVRIEPKFEGFTSARKFDGIIAATERKNGKWESYYLTKSGKIVGRDSLFVFDNSGDCESEGFIRFRDAKTDKVGMFDKNGKVVIPALYNGLSQVRNGLVVGLKDAKKEYWDKDDHDGCNHYSFVGGTQVLMDASHTILVEPFDSKSALDFYSVKKSPTRKDEANRESFLAKDGQYYSFIDLESEFKSWFLDLCRNVTRQKLLDASWDEIVWESDKGWETSGKQKLVSGNFEILRKRLSEIVQPNCKYFISQNGLNPFMFEGEKFAKYFDNCGNALESRYPAMQVVVTYESGKDISQNHFEFLRTDNGYKMISVVIRSDAMR